MSYINETSGQYPVSELEIRAEFPNTSFPAPFVPPENFKVVFGSPYPTYNPVVQQVREVAPTLTQLGHYEQTWEVYQKFETYTDEDGVLHTKESLETAATQLHAEQQLQLMATQFENALDTHLDNVAKQRRYDNRITCMVRAGFAGPFQTEAIAFATWVDSCNIAAYTLLANVQAGTAAPPASVEEFISLLPIMVWPE